MSATSNNRVAAVRGLRVTRDDIFTVWAAVLVAGFISAGGIEEVDPLFMTENLISVDEPFKYGIYYMVLLVYFGLAVFIG